MSVLDMDVLANIESIREVEETLEANITTEYCLTNIILDILER